MEFLPFSHTTNHSHFLVYHIELSFLTRTLPCAFTNAFLRLTMFNDSCMILSWAILTGTRATYPWLPKEITLHLNSFTTHSLLLRGWQVGDMMNLPWV